MPYVVVRGNLGMSNTIVFGLPKERKSCQTGSCVLPRLGVGWGYSATPVQVLNELECRSGSCHIGLTR